MMKTLARTLIPSSLRMALYEARQRPLKAEASQWVTDTFTSDLTVWNEQYQQAFGRPMNWEHPTTFSEKLRWLMRYDRDPIMTRCADKYTVRHYVHDRGLERILNPLYGVWSDPEAIDFAALPSTWAMKVTHGSGQNMFRRDATRPPNADAIRRQLTTWMKRSEYWASREWAYKNIEPKILCEALLTDPENGQAPKDYKFFCFGGVPRFVQVDSERFTDHRRDFFDLAWNPLPFSLGFPSSGQTIEAPQSLADMAHYARILSRDYPFVRVDFYAMGERVVFGEMTWYPGGGLERFTPEEYDAHYGNMIELPPSR